MSKRKRKRHIQFFLRFNFLRKKVCYSIPLFQNEFCSLENNFFIFESAIFPHLYSYEPSLTYFLVQLFPVPCRSPPTEIFMHHRQVAEIQTKNSSSQLAYVCLSLSHLTANHRTKGKFIGRNCMSLQS